MMRAFRTICISSCAFSFGYFAHMTFTHDVMIAPTVFAFSVWFSFWVIDLFGGD